MNPAPPVTSAVSLCSLTAYTVLLSHFGYRGPWYSTLTPTVIDLFIAERVTGQCIDLGASRVGSSLQSPPIPKTVAPGNCKCWWAYGTLGNPISAAHYFLGLRWLVPFTSGSVKNMQAQGHSSVTRREGEGLRNLAPSRDAGDRLWRPSGPSPLAGHAYPSHAVSSNHGSLHTRLLWEQIWLGLAH